MKNTNAKYMNIVLNIKYFSISWEFIDIKTNQNSNFLSFNKKSNNTTCKST